MGRMQFVLFVFCMLYVEERILDQDRYIRKRQEQMEKFKNRFKKDIQRLCETLEMAVAVIVLAGIVMTIFSLLSDFEIFHAMLGDTAEFKPFLEDIFVIVIGIEFLQMLCRPNSDNVMEVLIFLVARHMIIGDTPPMEDFISVISVGLLCVLRRYLHVTKEKEREKEKSAGGDGADKGKDVREACDIEENAGKNGAGRGKERA